jgi:ribosomal protein S18 acetylase RimI-like enzyme
MTEIQNATPSDLERIVALHIAASPDFFLTLMGRWFLRAYYSLVLDYPQGIILTARASGRIVGFVAGFHAPHDFYVHMSTNQRRLYLPAVTGVLRRPRLAARLLYNKRSLVTRSKQDPGSCELSSIGVHPGAVGRGVGRDLLAAFLEAAKEIGAKQICLTTDAAENEAVNRFYVKNGFRLNRRIMSGPNRQMNEYILEIE